MKFTKLCICNFLTIGNIDCGLDDKGLVLIQGENVDDTSQDSNGSGKSSLPDALSWCLFGETARGLTGDAVVNRKVGKDCMVYVAIQEGPDEYVVRRHRKHRFGKNKLEAFKNGTEITKGTDKLTQQLVNEIIGCSVDVFNAAVYAGQEKMPDLPAMTDRQLKELIEQSAGIDRLQRAYEVAKKRMTAADKDRIEAQAKLDKLEALWEQTKIDIDDAAEKQREWAANQKAKIAAEVEALKERKAELDAMVVDDPGPIMLEMEEIKKQIGAVAGEKAELDRLNEKIADLQHIATSDEVNYKHQRKASDSAKKAFEEIEERVGKPCGECGKTYDESDLHNASALAQKTKRKEEALMVKIFNAMTASRTALREAQEERDMFEATMTDTDELKARLSDLRSDLTRIERDVEHLQDERQRLKDRALALKAEKSASNPHDATYERLQERSTEMAGQYTKLQDAVRETEKQVAIAEAACRVFGPAGVRAHILDNVTPFLNVRTNEYLSILTDSNITAVWSTLGKTAKGELREKFNIEVESKVGAASFGGLSGGEKRKVRLACSMALQDLVSSRASKPIELYMADEIDDALDESGLERLMTILDQKAKDRGTVLVISHNSLSDWIRHSVTIRKEAGLATMVDPL